MHHSSEIRNLRGFQVLFFDDFLQWASSHPNMVRYCSSLIFFSSEESLEEGVYRSTQCAQLVQLATRDTTFPLDSCRLAHLQGSKHKASDTFDSIGHEQIESLDVEPTILDVLASDLGPLVVAEGVVAELAVEVQIKGE